MRRSKGRRRSEGLLIKLMMAVARLPWWLNILFAAITYLVFYLMTGIEIRATGQAKDVGGVMFQQMLKTIGMFGQYFFTFVFVIGALVSAYRQVTSKPIPIREIFLDLPEATVEPTIKNGASSEDLYAFWKASSVSSSPDRFSLDLLRAIDWKRFEEVCAEYFRLCGFHATTQSHGPDGGIDVKLYAPDDRSRLVNIVQCKQWSKPIGPKALRELLGVMTASKLSRGIFVASSTFNDEAIRFATENHIYLLDGRRFLDKILERPTADQARLLKVATEGDYLTPSCPSCGIKLLKRERKKDKVMFWGCANFPRCRYILNV